MGGNHLRFLTKRLSLLQGLSESLFGFAQVPQDHLHISYNEGAGNHIHLIAQFLHVIHPGAHGLQRGFHVAGSPVSKPEGDGSLCAEVKIIIRNDLNGQLGIFHRFGQVALVLGVGGAD